jgi:hypothetical protein
MGSDLSFLRPSRNSFWTSLSVTHILLLNTFNDAFNFMGYEPMPCFTPFCFNAPCQFTLLNLRPFKFGLTLFGWVITSYLSLSSSSSSVICQTTGPQPLPKRFLHLMRSRASSFKLEYPLLSPRPSSNFLRLLPRLFVTSICPFIFPSITCSRRQFLRKM